MTCGLGLGILLVFWVQAEHVGCFWTNEAQNLQNSNTYVGFPPPKVRLLTSGSYPQNQVRQGFSYPHVVQSSSSNTGPAVYSGSGPGLFTRSSAQVVSQPAQSSVRLVQSRQKPFSPRANAPHAAKQSSGLSLGRQRKNQKNSSVSSKTSPKKKGKHSSNSQSHGSKKSNNFKRLALQSAARALAKAAVKIPLYYSQVSSSASPYGPVAPGQHGPSAQMQMYARGPANGMFSNYKSEATRFSPWTQRSSVSNEGLRPRSWLQTYKTSPNLAVSSSSTPAQGFATVYQIPEHFAIRWLKKPAQNQVTMSKLQIPTAAPQWLVPFIDHVQGGYPEARWPGVKMQQVY